MPGDSEAKLFYLELPQDLKTEYEYLRVSISNDDYKRTIYREIKMPN
jgi:hypothetical protein